MINIKVAELMGKHKLTRKALSEMTGIRPNTISALWSGNIKRLEIQQIDKLCTAFKCQPSDLMEYIPNDKANSIDQ